MVGVIYSCSSLEIMYFQPINLGKQIENGEVGFKELEAHVLSSGEPGVTPSGRQEMLENLVNEFL